MVTVLMRIRLGAPVLFRQQRPGLHDEPFTICKFRTMTNARDAKEQLLPDAERLTPFSRFLRRTSMDEIPELINVINGSMSLVGPRPLLMEYLSFYSERQCRRHLVKPGITGWAQVNGRNAISWEEKFELDIWYVENQSFILDLKILLMTIICVLRRRGVTPSNGEEIMPRFTEKKSE